MPPFVDSKCDDNTNLTFPFVNTSFLSNFRGHNTGSGEPRAGVIFFRLLKSFQTGGLNESWVKAKDELDLNYSSYLW